MKEWFRGKCLFSRGVSCSGARLELHQTELKLVSYIMRKPRGKKYVLFATTCMIIVKSLVFCLMNSYIIASTFSARKVVAFSNKSKKLGRCKD